VVDTVAMPLPRTPPEHRPRPARQWEFDALRVAAICGVVAIHIIGLFLGNRGAQGGTRWWLAVAVDVGAIWAVPVFVMLSGALVLTPAAHAAGPAAFYRKRFARIIPAMIVWHLVYLLLVRGWLHGESLAPRRVAVMLIDAKIYTALYFLWLIAGLYLLAPVLATWLHAGGPRRALATAGSILGWTLVAWALPGVSALLGATRPVTLGAWTQWGAYVGYFVAGWALHKLILSRRALAAAAVLAVVLLAELIWQYGQRGRFPVLDAVLPVHYLGAVTAAVSICLLLVAVGVGARWSPPEHVRQVLKRLSDASFGVFLVHLLIFALVQEAVPATRGAGSLSALVGTYAVVLVASFAVSVGAARVPYLRAIF
jgi:surface polysaccharide O-acyltransferase-like enzyme